MAVFVTVLASSSPLTAQTTYNFDGGAGATNSSWANATNWAGDALPAFDTNAVLVFNYNFSGGTNIPFTGNSYTVRSLVFGSDLTGGSFTSLQIRTKSQIGGGSASLGRTLTLNGGAANASIVIENISDSSLNRLDLGSGAGASEGSVAFATSVDLTNNSGSALFLFNNPVSGTGALNKYGIGTAAFNRANTFSGGINIYEGTVELFGTATAAGTGTVTLGAGNSSGNAVLALAGSGATVVTNTSAVTVGAGSGTRTIANSTNFSTANAGLSGAVTLNTNVTFDIAQYTANTHDRITVSGAVTGAGGIVKSGTGLLILSNAANSFGSLQINEGQVAVQTNATVTGLSGSGGSLALSGGTLTVNASADSSFGGGISGAGNLTKSGNGALTLSASNTYSGGTTVSAGTLLVNNTTGSATGSGTLTVASGASLGGSGFISGATTMQSGSLLRPGNSPGVLTFNSELTLESGANMVWELWANTEVNFPVAFDQIVVGGNLLFSGSHGITLDFGTTAGGSSVNWTDTFWESQRSWIVYDVTGTTTGSSNLSLLNTVYEDATGASLATVRTGASFSIAQVGSDVVVNYIPEPSSSSLLLLSLAGLAALRKFRRKA